MTTLKAKPSQNQIVVWTFIAAQLVGCTSGEQPPFDSNFSQTPVNTPTAPPTQSLSIATNSPNTLSPTPNLTTVASTWFSDPHCRTPCWNGITPGSTTYEVAIQNIQNLPYVAQETIEITDAVNGIDAKLLQWYWSDYSYRNSIGFKFVGDDLIVSGFGLYFPRMFTIGELIAQIGEPEYVLAEATFSPHGGKVGTFLAFYYFKQGLYTTAADGELSINSKLVYLMLNPKSSFAEKPD